MMPWPASLSSTLKNSSDRNFLHQKDLSIHSRFSRALPGASRRHRGLSTFKSPPTRHTPTAHFRFVIHARELRALERQMTAKLRGRRLRAGAETTRFGGALSI